MTKKKAIVLGCGRVGATMVRDLAADRDFAVIAADVSAERIKRVTERTPVETRVVDLADPAKVKEAVADQDVVLGALPSRIGFQTLRAMLELRKPYCDISFIPEDAMELDDLAKQCGATAVVDCGVAPGLSNLIVGKVHDEMSRAEHASIMVGGLPKVRRWPFDYRAPFAPSDVVEEYTRPARVVVGGKVVVKDALTELELVDFEQVGTLEAFITDGLRSLASTLDIPNMVEKTMRYPGHMELMRVFRETGLFSKEPIEVGGTRVCPLDVTSALLFRQWAPDPGEQEFTIMRVIVEGVAGSATPGAVDGSPRRERHTYDLYDEYNVESGDASMARTTAFPCTIIARMLARGNVSEPGVFPPELLAPRAGLFDHVLSELDRRGVKITKRVEAMPT